MRAHVLLLALVAGCGSSGDKTATHFCQNVRIVFHDLAGGDLDNARRGLSDIGRCSEVNEASSSLRSTILAFKAAAVPFRERPEVARTLDALDKLELDEVNKVRCFGRDEVAADQVESLRKSIDNLEAKLAAVAATCPSH
jgi:hypothetical protein